MAGAPKEGSFVVLEGIDGSGTTTQAASLMAWLQARGVSVHRTREPSDGPIGVLIRQALKKRLVVTDASGQAMPLDPGAMALLFAADRLDHLAAEVQPRLGQGQWVLSDRYVVSSLAYQSVELPESFVTAINSRARKPDLVLFLRVRPEVALERVGRRQGAERELYEERAILERVSELYDRLGPTVGGDAWRVIDGEQSPEAVFAALTAELESFLSR